MPADWVITTCVKEPPDPYTDHILPITGPLFAEYAERWGMDYDPHVVTKADVAEFVGHIPTRGTEPVYASIPHRRALLDSYEGVLYLDEDVVITNPHRTFHRQVTDLQPIGMVDGLTGAIQVLRSGILAKHFLDRVWDMRHEFKRQHWAEEAAMKSLMGWDHDFAHGDPAKFLGDTDWTKHLVLLSRAMRHPLNPEMTGDQWFAMNPGGIWPFGRRLEIVREWAAKAGRTDAIRGG